MVNNCTSHITYGHIRKHQHIYMKLHKIQEATYNLMPDYAAKGQLGSSVHLQSELL